MMTKVKHTPKNSSPIARRTRSKNKGKNNSETLKKKNLVVDCSVSLVRLTAGQIMEALMSDGKFTENSTSKKYNLRTKKKQSNTEIVKNIKKTVASNAVLLPKDMPVTRLWSFLKKECTKPPTKDLCCLAKMRTHSPWPSLVLDVNGDITKVYFFGEGTTGNVQTREIVPFENCADLIKKYLKTKNYPRAVRELELSQNIPRHSSVTIGF